MDGHLHDSGLESVDPTLAELIALERTRQRRKLIMIASESICPRPVREVMASELGNLYAEGYPSPKMCGDSEELLGDHAEQLAFVRRYSDRRYYKGVEIADLVESVARRRAAEAFATAEVPAREIFANVQPLSGAAANNAVYNAFVPHGGTVMGMSLSHGGHLTHGSPVNRSGRNHRIVSYSAGAGGRLDYSAIRAQALECRPKLVIAGYSAFPWDVDWARFRAIADEAGAMLLADIAHTAGLVAAGVARSPLAHAHVVSFTTHKTLCGPRGAVLLSTHPETARKLDAGVFPGEQGGPHVHQIAAKAVAMKIARTDGFKTLMRGVVANAAALAEAFRAEGLSLAYGGTDTHMVLVDLRQIPSPTGRPLSGETASRLLDLAGITCNKNTIHGDASAVHPSAVRFGTTWVTQRGFGPAHMRRIARIVATVLRAARPYSVVAGSGPSGRGWIDLGVLERARREVDALVAEVDAGDGAGGARHGYPYFLVPRPEKAAGRALVEVAGPRAPHLLDGACTADVRALDPGTAVETLVLDPDGEAMAAGTVRRVAPGPDAEPRFALDLAGPRAGHAAGWLRALSDGFAQPSPDLLAKVEGPAKVVELPAGPGGAAETDAAVRAGDPRICASKPFFVGRGALRARGLLPAAKAAKEEFRWTPPAIAPRRTCLYGEHARRTQKRMIVPFADWLMPLWFKGIAPEHEAVRCHAGLFDVSHMGVLEVTGPDAERFLDVLTVNYVPWLRPGEAHYSYLLDPDGAAIDDILVYRRDARRFMVVVNAANAERDEAWIRAAATGRYLLDRRDPGIVAPARVEIRNLKDASSGADRRVDLALQGPASLGVLATLAGPGELRRRIERLGRFEFAEGELDGGPVVVSRTGYTGEDLGFEIYAHPDAAPRLWNRVLEVGSPMGVEPAGLGARDSTRTEAGLPLHGHELAGPHGVSPIEAGYGSFVRLHKPFFVGRERMVEQAERASRRIVRLRLSAVGGKMVRPGNVVVEATRGEYAGIVTSSTAVKGWQFCMALLASEHAAPGTRVFVYPLSEKDRVPPARALSELAAGERVVVPREGMILTRFPRRDERTGRCEMASTGPEPACR